MITLYDTYNGIENEQELKAEIAEHREVEQDTITDEEMFDYLHEQNEWHYDDLSMDLKAINTNGIIAIAEIGTWQGKKYGYKILDRTTLDSILTSDCDYCKWYIEHGNIKFRGSHHDGTNYVEYREIKDWDSIDNLCNKLYNNEEVSRQLLNYYTSPLGKLLPEHLR